MEEGRGRKKRKNPNIKREEKDGKRLKALGRTRMFGFPLFQGDTIPTKVSGKVTPSRQT